MKLLALTTAAALSFSASVPYAQQTPETPPSSPPQADAPLRDAPPPAAPAEQDQDTVKGEWRMHPPLRERGARFRIETGRTTIDLRCPDGEPAKDCADLLLQVLDRLQGDTSSDSNDRRDYDQDRQRSRWDR